MMPKESKDADLEQIVCVQLESSSDASSGSHVSRLIRRLMLCVEKRTEI